MDGSDRSLTPFFSFRLSSLCPHLLPTAPTLPAPKSHLALGCNKDRAYPEPMRPFSASYPCLRRGFPSQSPLLPSSSLNPQIYIPLKSLALLCNLPSASTGTLSPCPLTLRAY